MKTFTIRRNGLGEPNPEKHSTFLSQSPLAIPLGGRRLAFSKAFASRWGRSLGVLASISGPARGQECLYVPVWVSEWAAQVPHSSYLRQAEALLFPPASPEKTKPGPEPG